MKKKYPIKSYFGMLVLIGIFLTTHSYGQLAKCKGKYLGNVIAGSVRSDFNSLWNAVTAENNCKWQVVEPTRDQMNWSGADLAYNHAKKNGFPFRWHTFVWGSQYPNWITALNAQDTKDEVEELMRLVAARYPDIDQIDVVNEALPGHAPAPYRDDLGGAGATGYDWIVWSFQKARQYFPKAKLILNDYGLENDPNAINEILKIVKVLKDRNLIDGLGTQAHEFNINTLSAATLKSRLDQMSTGGVPIYVTELDISGDDNTQKTRYQTLFPVYWNHPNVAGISIWGYVEGQTWKTNTGLLNSNGTDRPAMTWLKSYMASLPNVNGCGVVSNTPPTVSITAPAANATFMAPATVTISANASDSDGSVSSVQFYNGTILLGSDASAPYSFTWSSVPAGTYTITAKATDNSGAATTSAAVTITVTSVTSNQSPAVSITSPASNTSYIAPASITISANASDSDGSVSSVQFYNGTTLLGSDATAPYSFTWSSVPVGTYSITARATDNSGNVTTSSAVSITVTGTTSNQAPVIRITAPAANASFTAPASISITATASDADGTVSSVQFYNGATLLGSDATAPYSFTWTNVAAGTYTITAKATDNNGASTTSAAITVVVSSVQTSSADILGPDCGATSSSVTFELNATKRSNATSYSWWFQGYTQRITPVSGQPYRVTINTGPYFTGGEVCVQVQYSAAPYSAKFCKSVTRCSSGQAMASVPAETAVISPNPFSQSFILSVGEDVERIVVVNTMGVVVDEQRDGLSAGTNLELGSRFPAGIYTMYITYASGRTETKRIQKAD